MASLYYKNELLDQMKIKISDAVREEINAFADDNSEQANIALRNRIAGMYDLADIVEKSIKGEEE